MGAVITRSGRTPGGHVDHQEAAAETRATVRCRHRPDMCYTRPMHTDSCPGCGVRLPATAAFAPDHYNASAACYQLYGELSAYTLTHNDGTFLHQHAVDTYAAQHAGATMRPITISFALMGR